MKFFLTVKASSKHERVEKLDDTHFRISVKAPAQDGKANEATIKALSVFLDVPKSSLTIVTGHTSKHKIIELS